MHGTVKERTFSWINWQNLNENAQEIEIQKWKKKQMKKNMKKQIRIHLDV